MNILLAATLIIAWLPPTANSPATPAASFNTFIALFPELPLPFTIDETRWNADKHAKTVLIPSSAVSLFLNQDPEQGQYFAVGRIHLLTRESLEGVIVKHKGVEDGVNDVYYLFVLVPDKGPRASVELATFNGGEAYDTVSRSLIGKDRIIRIEETYDSTSDDTPPKKTKTVTGVCYTIRYNGLPQIYPCK